ncbi:MAG TPA: hypothetical protein P5513_06685 [Candidatus Diapherotrites archaeon]|nr:hypothetical protein [Candidatus Diapherotrites archaeon]
MKYIIIFITISISVTLCSLMLSIREKYKVRSMSMIIKLLEDMISTLIDFFMQEKGVHDTLVHNLDLSSDEYLSIYKEAFAFVIKNIPRKLQRRSLAYMTKDQYFDFISREIYRHLNMIYNVIE